MPIVTERHALERVLVKCKERLDLFRREGMELQAALAEADLNAALDRLREITGGKHHG